MTLHVIGAGYGRTGTLSLKSALEQLGLGPCYHIYELQKSRQQLLIWSVLRQGGTPDWDAIFAQFHATVDWPTCLYVEELAARYPAAKVVLTVRDPERWYDSMARTILPTMRRLQQMDPLLSRVMQFAPSLKLQLDTGTAVQQRIRESIGGDLNDRDGIIAAYQRHNAQVQASIPPERLLVYEVSQGWGPLCAFLGQPVPSTPFPRSNDEREFARRTSFWNALRGGTRP